MKPAPPVLVLLLALAVIIATGPACSRPIHTRTYAFHVAGHAGYDHPAVVPEGALALALHGRVAPDDLPGLAHAMSRAFARLRPDQVIYYRHPDGGAFLFAVRGGKLIVTPYGLRRGAPAEYELSALAAADRPSGPPKVATRGEAVTTGHADAELEVEVAFAIEQYLFVDDTFVGTVAPGQTGVFKVHAGHARVVAADGKDGSNPVTVEIDFKAGRMERLTIEPRFE